MLEAFFQEYLIVPTAPVTVPAVTEPVLVPKQEASDLVEAAKAKAVAGCYSNRIRFRRAIIRNR
jgi:hypothetical protein